MLLKVYFNYFCILYFAIIGISKKLLEKIHLKEIVTFDEFINFLKDYCYTIKILSEENVTVSTYLKKHKDKNFIEAYNDLGILLCDKEGNLIKEINLPII